MIVTARAIKDDKVGFSNSDVYSSHPFSDVFGQCKHNFEREEESTDFKNMYSPRSPPPLTDTGVIDVEGV